MHAGRVRQSGSPAGRGWYRQGAWCQLVRTMAGEDGSSSSSAMAGGDEGRGEESATRRRGHYHYGGRDAV